MELNRKLFDCVAKSAATVHVTQVCIGLGFTAVTTSGGGIGIAATGVALSGRNSGNFDLKDFEDRPAADLLPAILSSAPMERTMAMALINALNQPAALNLPEDPGNTILFDHFGIFSGARVAMVGYFPPLVRFLESRQVPLSVVDDNRGIGDKKVFYRQLAGWADVLILTGTSIINNSVERILSHAGPDLKTIIMGPSTPMLPGAFSHLPVHMLAGTAITDLPQTLKKVRHGGGAHSLKGISRKVYQLI
ncbi:DUF364 domain-containing protein [Desulfosarcina ovata]|uniref:Heavy-metal chelation domain-containing protein n=1 Tax=Desulfosarcina ovata subsp. ovata TaxID=2752305 RepID=A0A5K8ACR0_9BACT|nr:DUF364 domain-containing protein [Desulfosarcina ovata]BBO90268.1 hypothetical protein DSCOOX_34480 [Desulfosarcina ovata subsp. ovata]